MTIKYAIIGLDNESSKDLVVSLSSLKGYTLVSNSENSNKILDVILATSPDLIYLNVDNYSNENFNNSMNTIYDLYRSLPQKPYIVALATSKKQAYNCIKRNFFYYLLRPLNELELQKLDYKLRASFDLVDASPKKLCLQTYSEYRFIDLKDILFLKSDNNATEFYMKDKTKIIAFKTLKYFESILPKSFKRIHQSFVINQNYISRIHLGKSECYLKPLQKKLPFSKSYRQAMTELATSLSSKALT